MNISEEIRDLNAQMSKIKDINEASNAGSIKTRDPDPRASAIKAEEIMNAHAATLSPAKSASAKSKKMAGAGQSRLGVTLTKQMTQLAPMIQEEDDEDEVDKVLNNTMNS